MIPKALVTKLKTFIILQQVKMIQMYERWYRYEDYINTYSEEWTDHKIKENIYTLYILQRVCIQSISDIQMIQQQIKLIIWLETESMIWVDITQKHTVNTNSQHVSEKTLSQWKSPQNFSEILTCHTYIVII